MLIGQKTFYRHCFPVLSAKKQNGGGSKPVLRVMGLNFYLVCQKTAKNISMNYYYYRLFLY